MGYIDLYLIHGPCPIGELEDNLWVYSEVLYIWRLTHGRTNKIRITPACYSSSMYDAISEDSCMLQWLTNISTRRIDMHPFMVRPEIVVFSKKFIISLEVCAWQHVVQTKFYTCYLLKAWATLVHGLRFNYRQLIILNHRYNKTRAKILLRYSLQKVRLLVFSDPRFLLSGLRDIAQTGLKAENSWKFVFQLSEDSLDNLNER